MAYASTTTPTLIWESAVAAYAAACRALEVAESNRLTAEDRRAAAEENLLATPAPHLAAVAIKLEAMWTDTGTIMAEPTGDAQRTLIADIKRFAEVIQW